MWISLKFHPSIFMMGGGGGWRIPQLYMEKTQANMGRRCFVLDCLDCTSSSSSIGVYLCSRGKQEAALLQREAEQRHESVMDTDAAELLRLSLWATDSAHRINYVKVQTITETLVCFSSHAAVSHSITGPSASSLWSYVLLCFCCACMHCNPRILHLQTDTIGVLWVPLQVLDLQALCTQRNMTVWPLYATDLFGLPAEMQSPAWMGTRFQ